MEQVSDILKGKQGPLLTISSEASVFDMVAQMVEANVGVAARDRRTAGSRGSSPSAITCAA